MIAKDDRCLRIGILGCGPIAQFAHLDACRKAKNAELYAICDLADDLRERMAASISPRRLCHYDAMLADPQVEAVIIAIADQFHVPRRARGDRRPASTCWSRNRWGRPSSRAASCAIGRRRPGWSFRSATTAGSIRASPSPTSSSRERWASGSR